MELVDGRPRLAALSKNASGEEHYNLQPEGLQMCLVICKDRQPMTACRIVIYGRSCNTLFALVLSISEL